MSHSRPAARRYNGPLGILPAADDCIPFSWKGKQPPLQDPHPSHQTALCDCSHGAEGKGSQAAAPQHISLLFQAESALFPDCMAQGCSAHSLC